MKKNIIYIAAAALLSLAACNKGIAPDASGEITIDASIGAMTRVSYNGVATEFTSGDQIAVYAWMGGSSAVPDNRVVDGVWNTLGSDGLWTPATPMLWKTMVDPHYFLGIFPARTVSSFTADAYTLNPADFTASDLLIATNLGGVKATDGPVSLSFDHAMAKLNVNLKFRTQWDATPTVSGVTVTACKTATVNYLTKAVTATGTPEAIDIPATATAATGYALSFSGLQVPQDGVRRVVVTIAGKEYVYESATDIPLVGGQYTTLGLLVGKDKMELGSITVADWTAGSSLPDGNAVYYEHYPLAAADVSSEDIGKVLAADGYIYADATTADANGGGARAVIAYAGSVPNYFDKFLAIAMDDVDDSYHTWAEALSAVSTFAGTHAITIGGTPYNGNAIGATYYDIVASNENATSATRTTGVVKGWRLPSVTDWRYIFDGLGRQKAGLTLTAKKGSDTYSNNATPTDPLGVVDGMYYYKDGDAYDASSLREAINAACGNTALQSDNYWSSSEYSDDSNCAWDYVFYDGKFWWVDKTGGTRYGRAVFAY